MSGLNKLGEFFHDDIKFAFEIISNGRYCFYFILNLFIKDPYLYVKTSKIFIEISKYRQFK
jgi:hypothetical protein